MQLKQVGLAGPVGADEPGDGAGLDVEARAVDGAVPAELLDQRLDLEQGGHWEGIVRAAPAG